MCGEPCVFAFRVVERFAIFESEFAGIGKIEHTYYICYTGEASEVQRGRSFDLYRKRRCLMLKEILSFILSVLPNWLAVFLMAADLCGRKKNKRVDEVQEK